MYINILGTEYEIVVDSTGKNPKLKNANGSCELYSKKIIVEGDYDNDPDNEYLKKKVLRHEIVHAYFYESGINSWCQDEALVDWIALQIPKILHTMKEANCI